ncbi:MAG: hypothetical protein HFG80_08125 [Eubacterium sp.]|jgi:uncharacterized protein YjdB|nr:hypothetical protein [Eubacterium sp.]
MKKLKAKAAAVLLLVACILIMPCRPVFAEQATAFRESVKILFIGNSFSKHPGNEDHNVGKIVQELAKTSGRHVEIKMLSHNGAHLSYYAFLSEKYKKYYREATNALMNRQWDYIVLQDYSKNGIQQAESEMFPAICQLNELALKYQNHAKVLLYATHGYKDGSVTMKNGKKTVLSKHQMQTGVAAACDKIGKELNLTVVPVGMMFWHCNQIYPSVQLYATDRKHPCYAGYYLAACLFYYQIFHEIPSGEKEDLSGCSLSEPTMRLLEGLVDNRAGISAKEKTVTAGKSVRLQAYTLVDSGYLGSEIKWRSMNEKIARVDDSGGKVTGVAAGSTQILAETESGLQAFCTVHVTDTKKKTAKKKLRFQQKSYKVTYGDTIKLLPVKQSYISEDNLAWFSSNQAVASVSRDGTVTALKPGRTTITVKDKKASGSRASYILYVACSTPKKVRAYVQNTKSGKNISSAKRKVTVQWRKTYGASSYVVYRSSKPNGKYRKIAKVRGNSYTDANVKRNRYYYYKVTAKAKDKKTESKKSRYCRAGYIRSRGGK